MPPRSSVLIVLSLASLLPACKPDCGRSLTVEKFIEASERHSWELTCEAMWTCPRERPLTEIFVGTYPSLEACKAHRPLRFSQGVPQVLASVEAGRLRFDPDRARRCLNWWKSQTSHDLCRTRVFDTTVCEGTFVGELSRGELCVLDEECAGDLECSGARPARGGADCHGTCRLDGDRRCGDATCALEEYCDRDEPGGELVCKPRVGAGEPCVMKDACSRASGTQCNRRRGDRDERARRRGTCIAPQSLDAGEECESNIFCKPRLHCIDSTCQALPPLRKDGESCDGKKRVCDAGLICLRLEGATQRTCVRPRIEGEPCRPTHQCEPHLTCNVQSDGTGTCTPRRPAGEPCDTPWLCQSFLCEDERCIEPQVCQVPAPGK